MKVECRRARAEARGPVRMLLQSSRGGRMVAGTGVDVAEMKK